MKNIFVTGATGFIGSHVVNRLLKKKFMVWGLTRENSNKSYLMKSNNLKLVSSSDKKFLIDLFNKESIEIVIHTATTYEFNHPNNTDLMLESNLLLGINILEAMRESSTKRLINFGTAWQHIGNKEFYPLNFYTVTKETFKIFIDYYNKEFGIENFSILLFDTYGLKDKRNKIFTVLKEINAIEKLEMGNENQKINPVNINDIAKGIEVSVLNFDLLQSKNNEYAMAYPEFITLKNLVEIAEKAKGYKLNIQWNTPNLKRNLLEPWDNFLILPNWRPQKKLSESLIHFFKN